MVIYKRLRIDPILLHTSTSFAAIQKESLFYAREQLSKKKKAATILKTDSQTI